MRDACPRPEAEPASDRSFSRARDEQSFRLFFSCAFASLRMDELDKNFPWRLGIPVAGWPTRIEATQAPAYLLLEFCCQTYTCRRWLPCAMALPLRNINQDSKNCFRPKRHQLTCASRRIKSACAVAAWLVVAPPRS